MSEAEKTFWQQEAHRAPYNWSVIAAVALLGTILGVPSDFANIRPELHGAALALRTGLALYFFLTALWIRLHGRITPRMYNLVKMMGFLAVCIPVTILGTMAFQHADLYMLGVIEAEFGLATFAPIPTMLFIPLVIATNLIYFASLQLLTLPTDIVTGVASTLGIFLALAIVANRVLVKARIGEIYQRLETQQEKERAESILASINDAFFILDHTWRFVYFNPASERLLRSMNRTQEDLLHGNIWTLFPNMVSHSLTHREFNRAMAANVVVHFDEYFPLLRAHLAISAYPSDEGLAVYATDITARKLSEERRRLREQAHLAESAREEEKTRISRDIHDDLGQLLTVLGMDMAWLQKRGGHSDPETRERIETMTSLVSDSIDAVKRITADLHPGVLEQRGLIEALRWFARQIPNRTGIRCHVSLEQELVCPGQDAALVFRIIQEAVTNVVRHAEAHDIWIHLEVVEHEVLVTVEDNGSGITPEAIAAADKSLGLRSMRERAQALGGVVKLERTRGGTVVHLTFPLPIGAPPKEEQV